MRTPGMQAGACPSAVVPSSAVNELPAPHVFEASMATLSLRQGKTSVLFNKD